jgi:hypothetical protein
MNDERRHDDTWPPIDRDQVTKDILGSERALELVAQPRGRGLDALERRDPWLEGASALGCEAGRQLTYG